MKKVGFFLAVFQIFLVKQSIGDVCLKSYKRKLCFKMSIQRYNSCLFEQFTVFEQIKQILCVEHQMCCKDVGMSWSAFKLIIANLPNTFYMTNLR